MTRPAPANSLLAMQNPSAPIPGRTALLVAAVCGIFATLITVASLAMGGSPPAPGAAANQFLTWATHYESLQMFSAFLDLSGQFLFLVMLAILVRRAEPLGGYLSSLVVVGAGVTAGVDAVWSGLDWGAHYLAQYGGDAVSIRALTFATTGFAGMLAGVIGIPYCLLYGALAVLVLRTRALPRGFGWVAALLAVLAGPGTAVELFLPQPDPIGIIDLLLTLIWPLATGIYLIARLPARAAAPVGSYMAGAEA